MRIDMELLPDPATLAVFLVATVTLNVTPGPDMLYVIANSVGLGRRAGVVSALGIGGGTLFHSFAGALGLSALLMSSAVAFDVVRYAGAAYLLYLGLRALGSKDAKMAVLVHGQRVCGPGGEIGPGGRAIVACGRGRYSCVSSCSSRRLPMRTRGLMRRAPAPPPAW